MIDGLLVRKYLGKIRLDQHQVCPRLRSRKTEVASAKECRDGAGTKQRFRVPAGATALYLGVADACGYVGSPGCYYDDVGDFVVSYTIH